MVANLLENPIVRLAVFAAILVYASMQTDINRKCTGGVSSSEKKTMQYLNVTMVILGVVGVLFYGYQLFMPAEHKAKVASYF